MPLKKWLERARSFPGAPGVRRVDVPLDGWRQAALDVAAAGGRLLALWADRDPDASVHAAFVTSSAVLVVDLQLPALTSSYPDLADIFPCAQRLQRAAADLCGVQAESKDTRPWLRHAAWPRDFFPLAPHAAAGVTVTPLAADDYPFVRVAGDGVHEIPVGPVHAGIIEPGHFRFSVVGEKVLKLEERLGYVHKGIEHRFSQLSLLEGHRLAARVSGDSAVAYSWAYCQALEGLARTAVPPRANWLRAIALESERIANHLGDLGALGNDAGFAFGLAQFSRLKEQWLRALQGCFGQRYLMDFVVPGGTACNIADDQRASLVGCAQTIVRESQLIRSIYDEHAGVRDRFSGAGIVSPDLARQLGLIGLAGRASGQPHDLRVDLPCEPYRSLEVRKATHADGDVAARVAVRFDELAESVRLIDRMVAELPLGEHRVPVTPSLFDAQGLGIIEGWRGPVMISLHAAESGRIRRCHPHDPSWQNWPVLEHAIIGNIVPDFPLINKSFNLSYSGHDL